MSERLIEITHWERPTVDREAGVIRHVKVLGLKSKNGRTYERPAVAKALDLYEGRGVNIDHRKPGERAGGRSVKDHFGELRGCALETDGVYADLHYLKSHPQADPVCEAAERMPGQLGLSHDAAGKTRKRGKTLCVESIVDVLSVDLVRYPATTEGLFESEVNPMANQALQEVNGAPPIVDPLAAATIAPVG